MDTKEAGRKGGNKTKKLYGKKHFQHIRRIAPKGKKVEVHPEVSKPPSQ